jgi:hypothetical protein
VGAGALKDGPWSLEIGRAIPPYLAPSPFEKVVLCTVDKAKWLIAEGADSPHLPRVPPCQGDG